MEVPDQTDQAFCVDCGASLSSPTLQPPPNKATSPAKPLRFAVGILLNLCALASAAYVTYIAYHRQWTSEASGYWLGTLILPFAVAYLIAGRRSRRNWLGFSVCFLAFTIIGSLASSVSRHKGLLDLPQAEMIKTIAGTMPLPDNASEEDKQTVAATRQVFADMNQVERSYNQRQAELTPELNKLYTAGAFASRPATVHMRDIVHKKLALDQETSAKLQHFPETVRTSLQKSSLSEGERRAFLEGLESQFKDSEVMKARQQMLTAEENWAAATTDLYDFALQHTSQIVVTKDAVGITSGEVRAQFNNRFHHALEQRDTFNTSVEKVFEARNAYLKPSGLTPADLGFSK
jgi:hypothetical protein